MCFSVYFDSILNEKWLFHIEIMISAAHLLGAGPYVPQRENLEKNMQLAMCFLVYIKISFALFFLNDLFV